ncbi:MAG: transporter [Gammaproteobacteria bacterium]|nr:transporter [Gammaproteobacteria bacterium]|tara:strand:+ start:2453 stop:2857 length:405 start_codon:yes stop_codon:yes gene_type:complete
MNGIVDLTTLLQSLVPRLAEDAYVFCSVPGPLSDYAALEPVAAIREPEGLTLVVPAAVAEREGFDFQGRYRQITLTVHSSLEAVGLTAAVSAALAASAIPANVVAGFYHDHLFVPEDKADKALQLLKQLSGSAE